MMAEQIALALGGKRSGRQWVCKCPAHNDSSPSLIVFDGREAPQVRCLAGCDQKEVINALMDRGLWRSTATDRDRSQPKITVSRETSDAAMSKHREMALRIFEEAVEPRSTLGESYLWQRGLTLPASMANVCVRFHAHCPRGSERVPALVVLMRDIESDTPVAIQRIFLGNDAVKDGKPMMLGPAGRAAMMLSGKWETFTGDLMFCETLHIAEGFETALALFAQGYKPIWALGSAGGILRFPVLFGVGELIVCADHDLTGISSAQACADRWETAGVKVRIWMREEEGADFADA